MLVNYLENTVYLVRYTVADDGRDKWPVRHNLVMDFAIYLAPTSGF